MVAAALDVDRAEVDDALEARRQRRAVEAPSLPGTGTWNSTLRSWLSIISSFLYCDSPPMPWSTGPTPTCLSRSGLKNATLSGIDELDLVAVDRDLDALGLDRARAAPAV